MAEEGVKRKLVAVLNADEYRLPPIINEKALSLIMRR